MDRTDRAIRFLERMQGDIVIEIRNNLVRGVDGHGVAFDRPWHESAVFPGGQKSDRAGQPTLIDTGDMFRSIRPGTIERRGNTIVATVVANENAKRQHRGFRTAAPVVIPRTRAQRILARAGNTSGIPARDRITLKNDAVAPPRPFISLSNSTLTTIVARAARGV